jgi:hypothetical protein
MALAGCASTHDSRVLRIDGTSQATFGESVVAIHDRLGPNRRLRFETALAQVAITAARGGETAAVTLARLDGLSYEEIIRLAGPEAKQRYLAAFGTRGNYVPGSGASTFGGFTADMNPNPFGPYPGQPLSP